MFEEVAVLICRWEQPQMRSEFRSDEPQMRSEMCTQPEKCAQKPEICKTQPEERSEKRKSVADHAGARSGWNMSRNPRSSAACHIYPSNPEKWPQILHISEHISGYLVAVLMMPLTSVGYITLKTIVVFQTRASAMFRFLTIYHHLRLSKFFLWLFIRKRGYVFVRFSRLARMHGWLSGGSHFSNDLNTYIK